MPVILAHACNESLGCIELLPGHDGRMAVLYQVLRHLSVVGLRLLREEVRRVGLLEEGVALVLLVAEYAQHALLRPFSLAPGCPDASRRELCGDPARRYA